MLCCGEKKSGSSIETKGVKRAVFNHHLDPIRYELEIASLTASVKGTAAKDL